MLTQKKINIPIFDYKLTIIISDSWEEAESKLPVQDVDLESSRAVTFSNKSIGGSVVAVLSGCQSRIVHEAVHIKNNIWEYIGYRPQADNDEIDAYLVTYIYEKIMDVYRRHHSLAG